MQKGTELTPEQLEIKNLKTDLKNTQIALGLGFFAWIAGTRSIEQNNIRNINNQISKIRGTLSVLDPLPPPSQPQTYPNPLLGYLDFLNIGRRYNPPETR